MRAHRFTALLLSVMMIVLNLVGTGVFAYADTEEPIGEAVVEDVSEEEISDANTEAVPTEEPEEVPAEEESVEVPEEVPAPAEEEAPEEMVTEEPEEEAVAAPQEEEAVVEEVVVPEEEPEEEPEEAPQDVAFDEKAIVDGVEIKVTADPGVFPEGATLQVKRLSGKEEAKVEAAVEKVADEAEVAAQYNFDITILDKEGKEIQPDTTKGMVNVAFALEDIADENLQPEVFHVKDNGKAEALEVETEGDTATVETDGFSAYSIRLVYTNFDTGTTSEVDIAVGQWVDVNQMLSNLGFTNVIATEVQADDGGIIQVTGNMGDGFYIRATEGDPGNTHGIEVRLSNGKKINITVATHTHNWDFSVSGNTATLRCTAAHCVWNQNTYTATLTGKTVTYNGNAHTATLSSNMPADCSVSGITYYSGTTQLESAPVNAGTYTAKVTVTPHGGTAKTISATIQINKANITVTPPTDRGVTYNGESQLLHTGGSGTGVGKSFTMYYADGSATEKSQFAIGSRYGTDAGTYTIKYFVPGDANHNDSPIQTLTCHIYRKGVTVTGITANSRVYNGTRNATLNVSGANFAGRVGDDNLTVTTTSGTFDNKNVGENKTVTFSVSLGGTKASNYYVKDDSQTTAKANITKKALTIYWEGAGDNRYTGGTIIPSAFFKRGTNLSDNDGLAYSTDILNLTVEQVTNVTGANQQKPSEDVGNGYVAEITAFTGADAENYDISQGRVRETYNIVKDLVVVNWNEESLVQMYNGANQLPTIDSITGIMPADVDNIKARVVNVEMKDVGIYKVTAELYAVTDESKLADYTLDSSKETWFEITKAPLTITASGYITYGQLYTDDDAHVSFTCEGFQGSDDENVLDTTHLRYWSDQHQQFANVGEYSIEADRITAHNYEITFEAGKLTVYPKPVELMWFDENGNEITAENNRFTYDALEHTLTAKVIGADENGDMVSEMSSGTHIDHGLLVVGYEDNSHTDSNLKTETWPGGYIAEALSIQNTNYTLLNDPHASQTELVPTATQNWFIDPLQAEIVWNTDSMEYNATDQWANVTAELTNLQGEDAQPVLTYTEGVARNVVPFEAEGPYNKEIVKINDDNYTLFQNNVTLTGDKVEAFEHEFIITQAPLFVRGSGWIIYGEEAKDVKDENGNPGANMVYVTTDHPEGDKEMLLGEDTAAAQLAGEAVFSSSDYAQFDDVSTAEKGYTVTLDGYEPTRNYKVDYGFDTLTVYPKTAELEWFDENEEPIVDDPEYTYDGKTHGVIVKVSNPENNDVVAGKTYEGNDEKNANVKTGTDPYTATVTELDSINYTLLKDPKPYTEGKVDPAAGAVDGTVIDGVSQDYRINPLKVELEWKYIVETYNGKNWDNRAVVKNLVKGDAYPLNVADAIKKDAGTYLAAIKGVSDKNYTIEGVDESLLSHEWTIKPLPVKLTWSDGNKLYNGKNQSVTATISNLCTGDKCTLTYENNVKKDAGKYVAKVTKLSNPNYTLEKGTGLTSNWEIKPLAVKLTWSKTDLVYNGKDQKVTATVSNICSGDKIALTYSGNQAKDAGKYTAKVTKVDNNNYTLTGGTGISQKWNIAKADLTVTAKNKTIVYGDKPANAGVKYAGFKGSDTAANSLTGTLTFKYNYSQYGKYGNYTIKPSGLSAKNYNIKYEQGTLKVKNKKVNLLAKATAKGSDKATITWTAVTGAKSYEIYLAKCDVNGEKYKLVKVATVDAGVGSYQATNLDKNTAYKFRVFANTESGTVKSLAGHFVTGNLRGKGTNPKSLTLNKTEVSIKQGKAFQIKGTITKVKPELNLVGHAAELRFLTSNKKVAKVDKEGKITAVAKGWCRIFVVTENGIWQGIDVTVK